MEGFGDGKEENLSGANVRVTEHVAVTQRDTPKGQKYVDMDKAKDFIK